MESGLSSLLRGPPELWNLDLVQTWNMERRPFCNACFTHYRFASLSSRPTDTRQFLQMLPGIALLTKLLTWKSGRFQNQRACGHGNQENVFMFTGLCPYGNNSVWRLILIHFLRGTFISAQLPSASCAIRSPCIRSTVLVLWETGKINSSWGLPKTHTRTRALVRFKNHLSSWHPELRTWPAVS